MPLRKKLFRAFFASIPFIAVLCVFSPAGRVNAQMPGGASPNVPENSAKQVSDHVYVIVGYPNVEFVVGSRATLAVDTGLGPRNGAIVLHEAQKLMKPNTLLYLTTTHFHPEHAAGAQSFPSSVPLIRALAQQEEMNQHGMEFVERFRNASAVNKELLQDATLRPADIVFDSELRLDLGGVSARLFWLGPAHTKGDELIFVDPDNALISGDVVMKKLIPNMPTPDASLKNWLVIVDKIEPLHPKYVIPDHGELGDASLIGEQRMMLSALQTRALELKKQGVSVDDAGRQMTTELKAKYPDWGNVNGIPNAVRRAYEEAQ